MYVHNVRMNIKPDRLEETLAAIQVQAETSRREEPGCLRFEVLQSEEDPTVIVLYEVYNTKADLEEAHRNTPHFADWSRLAAEVIDDRSISALTPLRLEMDSVAG